MLVKIMKSVGRERLYKILVCFLCSCQSMAALTLSMFPVKRILDKTIQFNFLLYGIGMIFLFLLFALLVMTASKPIISAFLLLLLLNVIAVINYYEFIYHGTVLTHQDIGNIGTAYHHLGNYKFELNRPVEYIILSFLVMLLALVFIHSRGIVFHFNCREGIAAAIVLVVMSYILVYSPVAVVNGASWSWERTYYSDSFVLGIMENIGTAFNKFIKPAGYTEDEIAGYSADKDESGAEAQEVSYPDIILILNETYYDVGHLVDLETDFPFMDNYKSLSAYKGFAASPYMCGGTNASEYELLTGNSMTLLTTSTPFLNLRLNKYPSIVGYLNVLGYATMAAHPFIPGNYHRETAWRDLGFGDMYFQSDFSDLDFYGNSWYCTDISAFKNFTVFYEKMPEDKPRFGYLLTIQNHGDWNENDPSFDRVHIGNGYGMSGEDCESMNEYLTRVKLTDEFIQEITSYFSSLDIEVIVCMVGDHCPSLLYHLDYKTVVEYSGGQAAYSEEEFTFRKRQVPYFIWSNSKQDYSAMPKNNEIDICALSTYALKMAGLPLTAYQSQLLALSEDAKCITKLDADYNGNLTVGYMDVNGDIASIYSGTG